VNFDNVLFVISLQTLNEVLAAGDSDQARQAFLTQVSLSCTILSLICYVMNLYLITGM